MGYEGSLWTVTGETGVLKRNQIVKGVPRISPNGQWLATTLYDNRKNQNTIWLYGLTGPGKLIAEIQSDVVDPEYWIDDQNLILDQFVGGNGARVVLPTRTFNPFTKVYKDLGTHFLAQVPPKYPALIGPGARQVLYLRPSFQCTSASSPLGCANDIWTLYNLSDTTATDLATTGIDVYPAWSSDGRHIALLTYTQPDVQNWDGWLVLIDLTQPARTQTWQLPYQARYSLIWSPDGSRLAYFEEDWDGNPKHPVSLRPLVFDAASDQLMAYCAFSTEGNLSWSKDGKFLAWSGSADKYDVSKVTILDVATGRYALVPYYTLVGWSVNGEGQTP